MPINEVEHWAEQQERGRHRDRLKGVILFIRQYTGEFLVSMGFHGVIFLLVSFVPGDLAPPSKSRRVEVIQQRFEVVEQVEVKRMPDLAAFKAPDVEKKDVPLEAGVLEPQAGSGAVDPRFEDTAEGLQEQLGVEEAVALDDGSSAPDGQEGLDTLLAKAGDGGEDPAGGALKAIGLETGISSTSIPFGYKARATKASRKKFAARFGGAETMETVQKSLQWLAEHQEPDGSWDGTKFEGESSCKVAVTGAAVLAFLGAGYSEHTPPFRGTVQRAVRFLNAEVTKVDKPHFGNNYGSAIALMALAEASIFGSSGETRFNAEKLAAMFLDMHKGEGWNYTGGGVDFSVSGWVALGLKSAQAADLAAMREPRAREILGKYRQWVLTMTSAETGLGSYRPDTNGTAHMTWVGMFQRQFLGFPRSDPFLVKAAQVSEPWIEKAGWIGGEKPGDVYGVYYGTLAAFQHQGNLWKLWNTRMKQTLLASQCAGDPKALGGSWDPTPGNVGKQGGRVMTTALLSLCLEVYYRYELMN